MSIMKYLEQDVEMQTGVPKNLPGYIHNQVAETWQDPPADMDMESEVEMSSLWQHFPADLLGEVAKHLPLHALIRFRCVAKSWSELRIEAGDVAGLHIRRSNVFHDGCLFTLHSGNKFLRYLKLYSHNRWKDYSCLGCINGLLAFAVLQYFEEFNHDVQFEVLNVFTGYAWTVLRPPNALGREPLFVGMSKLSGLPSCDISVQEKLGDDYLLVVAMADYERDEEGNTSIGMPVTSLLLQVFRGGLWSSSLLTFPPDKSLMHRACGYLRCGVLRGSIFYYLLMDVNNFSATLACTDLLSPDQHRTITTLCSLNPDFVYEWSVESDYHPKLAVCSGKLLLLHGCGLRGHVDPEAFTTWIQVLDEEKLEWRYESCVPEELIGGCSFFPQGVSDGGNELAVSDQRRDETFSYDFVSKAWSRIYNARLTGIHTDKIYVYAA